MIGRENERMITMKKIVSLILVLMLAVGLVSVFASCGDECVHIDKNDDGKCDKCEAECNDGCDNHVDSDDNGKCDICQADFADGCTQHVDKNDNGKCDNIGCNVDFTDGCDNHYDDDGDSICDTEGCDFDCSELCLDHTDANGDGICDNDGCGATVEAGDSKSLDLVAVMYSNSQPTKIISTTKQTLDTVELSSSSTLVVGTDNKGKDVAILTKVEQSLRSVEDGGSVDILNPVRTLYSRTEYLDGFIRSGSSEKEDGIVLNVWSETDTSLIPAKGSIAINLNKMAIKNYTFENNTLSFTVAANATRPVFGYAINSAVAVTIYTDGAVVTGIDYSYELPAKDNTPASRFEVSVRYSYDLEFPAISN